MNTEKWTASRVLVIKYDRDGRYHERLFRRTVLNNAFPVYIDPAGDRFEKTLLTTYPKACPIPRRCHAVPVGVEGRHRGHHHP